MACKVHPMDHSSSLGVCASCLRQRLCVILAAQAQEDARAQTRHPRNSEAKLTPLLFPVSPYIPPRKSDTAPQWDPHDCHVSNYHSLPDHKFFSTPHIGPTGVIVDDHKKKRSKFSLLSNLFKFRTGKRSAGTKEGLDHEKTSTIAEHYAFCLSPLVKASPNGHWGIKGCMPEEVDVIDHIRVQDKPRHSVPSPFCRHGSRKLADFGRHTRIH